MTEVEMPTQMDAVVQAESRALVQTYKRFPVVLTSGHGCRVTDIDGKSYLDFLGGIAVTILGHGHPAVVAAIQQGATGLIHTSNLYYTPQQVALAELLTQTTGMERVFFTNSGAEAVETALKISRKWGQAQGKFEFISFEGSFHGRTFGAMTATAQAKYQKPFLPLVPGFVHVERTVEAVEAAINDRTVAVLIEPIQGEGGIQVFTTEFLQRLRALLTERGVLLIADEIQSGMGRTGTFLAHEAAGIRADVVCMAKGLANGLPIGAALFRGPVAEAIGYGEHGSTFGGGPFVTSVAKRVIEEVLSTGLMDHAAVGGEQLRGWLRELSDPRIVEVRGRGLMIGIEFDATVTAGDLARKLAVNGLLVGTSGDRVIRLLPPLVVSETEVQEAVAILRRTLAEG